MENSAQGLPDARGGGRRQLVDKPAVWAAGPESGVIRGQTVQHKKGVDRATKRRAQEPHVGSSRAGRCAGGGGCSQVPSLTHGGHSAHAGAARGEP